MPGSLLSKSSTLSPFLVPRAYRQLHPYFFPSPLRYQRFLIAPPIYRRLCIQPPATSTAHQKRIDGETTIAMATNASVAFDLPPLPSYTLAVREPLIASIPDNLLSLILPIVAYWGMSMIYHFLDVYGLFEEYRLHTPAEVLKRNRVTRWEVVRDVVLQQIVQTLAGLGMSYFDPVETVGREQYDVAVWAQRLRIAQRAIPTVLTLVGVDAMGLAKSASQNGHMLLAGALAGGSYPNVMQSLILDSGVEVSAPAFTHWELSLASFIYWYFIPALQFLLAISIVDTWQYFLHRAMHLNRWLYGICTCPSIPWNAAC